MLSIINRCVDFIFRQPLQLMTASVPENNGAATLQSLHEKLLRIPDLRPIYANWESGLNPFCDELRAFVDKKIDKYIKDEKARFKTKAIDLGWFTSLIYPNAEMEQLKTMAMVSMTFFVFDDTIDKEIDIDIPDFASNFDAATGLRQHSIAYMRYWLSQDTNSHNLKHGELLVPEQFASFDALVSSVRAAPPNQINLSRLADDFQEFVDATAVEQRHRLSGKLPSIKEYWAYRHGVGAVFAFCTLHQYVTDTILPDGLAWCEEVMTMRLETSIQTIICNDLYSLKKEVKEDTPTNLVPIMISKSKSPMDLVINELIGQMYSSARRFDSAVASLQAKGCSYDDNIQAQLSKFVKSFETFQTGCFTFFQDAERFRIKEYKQIDGSYLIPL
ncbi:terpenoid synthase [Whalleya microplaca]|nr:terpenoid synthase [Whalleya microplaca]